MRSIGKIILMDKKKGIKILVMGLPGSGKTTFTDLFMSNGMNIKKAVSTNVIFLVIIFNCVING